MYSVEPRAVALGEDRVDRRRRRERGVVDPESDSGQLFDEWLLQVGEVLADRQTMLLPVALTSLEPTLAR
jgi:hypothetical protein